MQITAFKAILARGSNIQGYRFYRSMFKEIPFNRLIVIDCHRSSIFLRVCLCYNVVIIQDSLADLSRYKA